jgi:hypothetical protein
MLKSMFPYIKKQDWGLPGRADVLRRVGHTSKIRIVPLTDGFRSELQVYIQFLYKSI